MARGINKVILIGNLGADPEIRYLNTGGAVANITVATSESWTDKQTGEKKESVEWHKCVAYQRTAEIIGEYTRKGSKVYIEGKLKTRKWTDQQGVERYTTEVIIDELQLLDGRQDNQGAAPAGQQQQSRPAQQNAPQGGYNQTARPQGQQSPQGGYNRPQQTQGHYHANGSALPNTHQPQQQRPYNQPATNAVQQGGFNQPQQGFNQAQGGPVPDFDEEIPF